MKFTITRDQLQEGLAAVAAAITAKTTLPVLANVLVEASKQGGGLRLSGTDLDIAVSTTVPAEVDADGAVTLPAKKLIDIARELPSGPVRVTAAGEARVSIESGRSKFKLLGLPREEFPSFPTVKFDKAWKAAAGVVHKLVGHVAFAASTEESRPILNGVLWELRPDRMSIVASDQTHRIRLAFSGGAVKFSVQTPDLGEAQDELAVTYEGEPLEIGFNAMYLLEILKYMPTDEVRLTFKAPERASTVEPVGWDDPASYMALVMPLRLVD